MENDQFDARVVTRVLNVQWGVDWLGVTWLGERQLLYDILPELVEYEESSRDGGMYGYKYGQRLSGGLLLWGGTEKMGVHLELSGQALATWREQLGFDEQAFLTNLGLVAPYHVSRLDICADVVDAGLSQQFIEGILRRGEWAGRARSWREWMPRDRSGALLSGFSYYVGSPDSPVVVRIYDKKAERLAKGWPDEQKLAAALADWTRFEWQLRDTRANRIGDFILADDWQGLKEALTSVFDVVVPSADSKQRRWARAEWWQDVIGSKERGVLDLPEKVFDVEEALKRARIFNTRGFAMAYLAAEDKAALVEEFVEEGLSRLTEVELAAIEAYVGHSVLRHGKNPASVWRDGGK